MTEEKINRNKIVGNNVIIEIKQTTKTINPQNQTVSRYMK